MADNREDDDQDEREMEANPLGVPVEDLDSLRFGALLKRADLMMQKDMEGALQLEKELGMDFLDAEKLPPELRERYNLFVKNRASQILNEDMETVNREFELRLQTGANGDLPREIVFKLLRLAALGMPIEQVVKNGPAGTKLRMAYAIAISMHMSGIIPANMLEVGKTMGQFLERISVLRAKMEEFVKLTNRVPKGEIPADDHRITVLTTECAQMATELSILGIKGSDVFFVDSEMDKLGRKLFP